MRKRNQLNNGLDTSGYEIRISTSNMFAHLEDCLEYKRPKIPGPRNQSQNRPKHKSAGRKPEEEVDFTEGEWALVTRRSKKRESPAKPAKIDVGSPSCSRGDESEAARRVPGREEEKDEEDNQTSEPCPGFNIDLDDDFPPLSRAGLPDGMVEKKPRRPAKKSLHPDALSDSQARGDSISLKGCCLAEGRGGDKEVESASAAGPQAADGATQEDQDGSQSEAEDLAVFQFFSDEKLAPIDEPSVREEQLRDDLNKLLQGKYSSQGILTWAPDKKNPRKTLQPDGQSSSPEAAPSATLEGRGSSGPCAGDELVQSSAAEAQAAEKAEDEDEALGSSVKEEYITVEELQEELSRLLLEKHSSQEIIKWLQATIDDDDVSSDEFLEVLMTCVCQSEVIVCKRELSETRSGSVLQETRRSRALRTGRALSGDVPHIDAHSMLRWTPLLKVFLQDQEKELTALKALGDLMIRMQHPEGLLQMILDVLIDEEIIQESTFMKWRTSEEQQGNLELLSSVSRFFCWLEGYRS